ncbi:hypothetical protein DFP73DRAFT_532532 [Morchella snyderi]|nr:hypothetical protein DFP73DRAFT_532532 [Morchella snyderi]
MSLVSKWLTSSLLAARGSVGPIQRRMPTPWLPGELQKKGYARLDTIAHNILSPAIAKPSYSGVMSSHSLILRAQHIEFFEPEKVVDILGAKEVCGNGEAGLPYPRCGLAPLGRPKPKRMNEERGHVASFAVQ